MTGMPVISPALTVDGVSKRFGAVEVLREVGIVIARGEFVTLLGPSGCGKTTLLRIIAGLEIADCGRLTLNGRDITASPANRRPVNTVFQHFALFPHLDVFENVAFGLRARAVATSEVARRVDETLAMLRLGELARRRPAQLSGGQQQRVALARALVNEPELLLLDEPLSALDAKLRAEVQVELRRLQRRLGTAFLLVTHDQDEAMSVSDRILVMDGGRVVQAGSPQLVYDRPVNRFVAAFLGAANLISATRTAQGVDTPFGAFAVAEAPTWERGTLSIRPERITLCAERPSENGLRGVVRDAIYRGDHLDLFVEVGENQLRVRIASLCEVTAGSEVWLRLPREQLRVLDG